MRQRRVENSESNQLIGLPVCEREADEPVEVGESIENLVEEQVVDLADTKVK